MDDLWSDPKKQMRFLRILVMAASANQADLRAMTQQFLDKLFKTEVYLKKILTEIYFWIKLINKLIKDPIGQMRSDPAKRNANYASIADSLVQLLLLGWKVCNFPTSKKMKLSIYN